MASPSLERTTMPRVPQTLNGKPIEVIILEKTAPQRPSYKKPDIDVIDPEALRLRVDEVAIGIGRPNVYIVFRDPETSDLMAFNAKSLGRAPSTLDQTKGRIQSGVFAIINDLPSEATNAIRKAAFERQGSKHPTCVRANMEVLDDAGINFGDGSSLRDITMPDTLFVLLNTKGLSYQGQPLSIDFANSSSRNLESQLSAVAKSIKQTPIRHIRRFLEEHLPFMGTTSKERELVDITPVLSLQEQCQVPPNPDHKNNFTVKVANVSRVIGVLKQKAFGAQTFFRFEQDDIDIKKFIDTTLKPYADKDPSLGTRLKKLAFNPTTRRFISRQIQPRFTAFPENTEADLINRFEIWTEEEPHKYNIVARCDNCIKITKVRNLPENERNRVQKLLNWVLSKHVLLSENRDSDQSGVAFAGEVRRDQENIVWVNRDSGTFKPGVESLENFVAYLQELFPHIDIRSEEIQPN